jgi:chromosome segregation ATPase
MLQDTPKKQAAATSATAESHNSSNNRVNAEAVSNDSVSESGIEVSDLNESFTQSRRDLPVSKDGLGSSGEVGDDLNSSDIIDQLDLDATDQDYLEDVSEEDSEEILEDDFEEDRNLSSNVESPVHREISHPSKVKTKQSTERGNFSDDDEEDETGENQSVTTKGSSAYVPARTSLSISVSGTINNEAKDFIHSENEEDSDLELDDLELDFKSPILSPHSKKSAKDETSKYADEEPQQVEIKTEVAGAVSAGPIKGLNYVRTEVNPTDPISEISPFQQQTKISPLSTILPQPLQKTLLGLNTGSDDGFEDALETPIKTTFQQTTATNLPKNSRGDDDELEVDSPGLSARGLGWASQMQDKQLPKQQEHPTQQPDPMPQKSHVTQEKDALSASQSHLQSQTITSEALVPILAAPLKPLQAESQSSSLPGVKLPTLSSNLPPLTKRLLGLGGSNSGSSNNLLSTVTSTSSTASPDDAHAKSMEIAAPLPFATAVNQKTQSGTSNIQTDSPPQILQPMHEASPALSTPSTAVNATLDSAPFVTSPIDLNVKQKQQSLNKFPVLDDSTATMLSDLLKMKSSDQFWTGLSNLKHSLTALDTLHANKDSSDNNSAEDHTDISPQRQLLFAMLTRLSEESFLIQTNLQEKSNFINTLLTSLKTELQVGNHQRQNSTKSGEPSEEAGNSLILQENPTMVIQQWVNVFKLNQSESYEEKLKEWEKKVEILEGDLKTQVEFNGNLLKEKTLQVDELQSKVEKLERESQEGKLQMEEEKRSWTAERDTSQAKIATLEAQVQSLTEVNNQLLQDQSQVTEKESVEATTKLKEYENIIENLEGELEEKDMLIAQLTSESTQTTLQLQQLQTNLASVQLQLTKTQDQNNNLQAQLEQVTMDRESLDRTIEEARVHSSEVQTELSDARQQYHTSQRQLEDFKLKLEQTKSDLESAQTLLKSTQETLKIRDEEKSSLLQQYQDRGFERDKLERQIHTLQSEIESQKESRQADQLALESRQSQIDSLRAQLKELASKHQEHLLAVSAAKEKQDDDLHSQVENVTKELSEDVIKYYENEIQHLQTQFEEEKEIRLAREAEHQRVLESVAELDDNLFQLRALYEKQLAISQDQEAKIGSANSKLVQTEEQLKSSQSRIKELEFAAERSKERADLDISNALLRLEREQESHREDVERLTDELQSAERARKEIEEKFERQKRHFQEKTKELEVAQESLKTLKDELEETQAQLDDATEALESYQKDSRLANDDLLKLKKDLDIKLTDQTAQYEKLKIEFQNLQAHSDSQHQQLQNLQNQLSEHIQIAEEEINGLQTELDQRNQEIQDLKLSSTQSSETLREELNNAQNLIRAYLSSVQKLKTSFVALTDSHNAKRSPSVWTHLQANQAKSENKVVLSNLDADPISTIEGLKLNVTSELQKAINGLVDLASLSDNEAHKLSKVNEAFYGSLTKESGGPLDDLQATLQQLIQMQKTNFTEVESHLKSLQAHLTYNLSHWTSSVLPQLETQIERTLDSKSAAQTQDILSTELGKLRSQINLEWEGQKTKWDEMLAEKVDRVVELEGDNAELEKRVRELEEECADLETRLKKYQGMSNNNSAFNNQNPNHHHHQQQQQPQQQPQHHRSNSGNLVGISEAELRAEEAETRLLESTLELDHLQQKLSNYNKSQEHLHNRILQLETALHQKSEALLSKEKDLHLKESKLALFQDRVKSLERELSSQKQQVTSSTEELESSVSKLQSELHSLNHQNTHLKKSQTITESNYQETQTTLQKVQESFTHSQIQWSQAKSQLETEIMLLKQQKTTLELEKSKNEEHLRATRLIMEDNQKELERLVREETKWGHEKLSSEDRASKSEMTNRRLQTEIEIMSTHKGALESQVHQQEQQIQALQATVEGVKSSKAHIESELKELRSDLEKRSQVAQQAERDAENVARQLKETSSKLNKLTRSKSGSGSVRFLLDENDTSTSPASTDSEAQHKQHHHQKSSSKGKDQHHHHQHHQHHQHELHDQLQKSITYTQHLQQLLDSELQMHNQTRQRLSETESSISGLKQSHEEKARDLEKRLEDEKEKIVGLKEDLQKEKGKSKDVESEFLRLKSEMHRLQKEVFGGGDMNWANTSGVARMNPAHQGGYFSNATAADSFLIASSSSSSSLSKRQNQQNGNMAPSSQHQIQEKEELIQSLKSQNTRLRNQVSDLTSQLQTLESTLKKKYDSKILKIAQRLTQQSKEREWVETFRLQSEQELKRNYEIRMEDLKKELGKAREDLRRTQKAMGGGGGMVGAGLVGFEYQRQQQQIYNGYPQQQQQQFPPTQPPLPPPQHHHQHPALYQQTYWQRAMSPILMSTEPSGMNHAGYLRSTSPLINARHGDSMELKKEVEILKVNLLSRNS